MTHPGGAGEGAVHVLLADDDRLVRTGLRSILNAAPDILVVGEAADGEEAVEVARRVRPDVAVVDVRMPRVDGVEATRRLVTLDPAPAVLVVTTFDLDEYVHAALRAGASGFLLKDAPEDQLVAAVRTVGTGVSLLDPRLTLRLLARFSPATTRPVPDGFGQLTSRERQILGLMARGLDNQQIARDLIIAETTVKTHVSRVLAKLGSVSRIQAVVRAHDAGLIEQ